MEQFTIDINSDMGEFPEALENDAELMRYITSANVACGGHAGDQASMRKTLLAARDLKVSVGAHPSYPDRENFGRVDCSLSAAGVQAAVQQQILSLIQVADEVGIQVVHVKPHGALYHAASQKPEIGVAIGRAVLAADPQLVMVGQPGTPALAIWQEMGLRCVGEAFADRAYEPDGTLRKRTLPGAVHNVSCAAQQALDIALRRMVTAGDGSTLPVAAETICIHSDTPGAVEIAREINQQLKLAGVRVQSIRQLPMRIDLAHSVEIRKQAASVGRAAKETAVQTPGRKH
jgi:UPF0271 protein